MRYFYIIFFLFLFLPTASFADAKYEGNEPLLDKKFSRDTGWNMGWMHGCGKGKFASEMRKKVKALSRADWKKVMQGYSNWGGKRSIQCANVNDSMNWMRSYVKKLTAAVEKKTGTKKILPKITITSTAKTTTSTAKTKYCIGITGKSTKTKMISNNKCGKNFFSVSKDRYLTVYRDYRILSESSSTSTAKTNLGSLYCIGITGKSTKTKMISNNKCGKNFFSVSKDRYLTVYRDYRILSESLSTSTATLKQKYCQRQNGSVYSAVMTSCSNNKEITKSQYNKLNANKATIFKDQTEGNKQLVEAQNYINDLLAYIKTYPSTFDILEISNFMIGNKNILKGSWGVLEKEGFKLFKNYTKSSKDFLTFHANQNSVRNKDSMNKITTVENEIKKLINYFTFYLQQNVTSALAPDILDNIKLARETLTSKTSTSTAKTKYCIGITGKSTKTKMISNNKCGKNFFSVSKDRYLTVYRDYRIRYQPESSSTDIGKLKNIRTKLNNYIMDKALTSDYRQFATTQTYAVVTDAVVTDAVVTKKETKKEEKKINTTQISLKEDFKKAQSALKKLGFYDGVIDGLFGRVSIKALNAWQEQTNLTLTTTISFDLLAKLENGSSSSTKEVAKQEIIVNTKTTATTLYNAEQKAAQDYIRDLFEFVSINPDTFDIIQITELITFNKAILNNKWNEVQQKDFALLKEFTVKSEDFIKFHARKNDQRQKYIFNEIAIQNQKLKNIISYFRYYLKNNFASDIALSVIKNVKFAETSLEDQNLGTLSVANRELEAFISQKNLTEDYRKFVDSVTTKTSETANQVVEEKKQKELAEQKLLEEEKLKQFEDQMEANKELQKAQNYINDLLAYTKINPDTFDIITISEFMATNKNVLDGSWSNLEQEGFKLFKNYTKTSTSFMKFHNSQNDIRAQEILTRLTTAENEVKRYINYLTFYLQNNVTSKLVPGVLDNIKLAKKALTTKDLGQLNTANKKINTYLGENNLTTDYRKFVDSVSAVTKDTKVKTETKAKTENTKNSETALKTSSDLENQTQDNKNLTNLEEAQIYINDLLDFLKTNQDTFDIIKITELITVNRDILHGKWNEMQQKDFALLKEFTATSEDFIKFHTIQNDKRQKDILNEIALQNSKLKNTISYFKYYLKNNIASDIASSVIKNIKFAETSLEGQNLGALSNANAELEAFISQKNLTKEYKKYVKSLSSNDQEQSAITASTIDAIDLVNFDFIKNADDSDFITLVNLSGQAPNALLNLEGKVVFEKDVALSCFYQSKEIKNDLKYYLYDKVANKKFLALDQGFECNQNNLLSYDLIFFEKDALLREKKSYVATLAATIGSDQLQLFATVTKKEYEKDFLKREMLKEQITDDVLNEARLGFGSLIIANDNTTLCTDVNSSPGQISIMNLLANEFTRMGYGKSVNNVAFNNTEDTFINVQRGNCGFIYAGETSLSNLMTAFESSKTQYGVVPIWLSKKQVANEEERQENKEKGLLINLQKKKEQVEKEKKLEQERLKADGILKAQEQQALRDRNRNVVEAHVELMEKEIKILFNKDTFKDSRLFEYYSDLGKLMKKKFKEKWKLDQFSVTINDYGLSDYKGRKIATYMTDINFQLKNNDLGEYEAMCFRLAILADSEFNRWREPETAVCKTDDDKNLTKEELQEKYKHLLDTYKKRLNFQSAWIVE